MTRIPHTIKPQKPSYWLGACVFLLLTGCGGGEQRTPFLWQNTLAPANTQARIFDEIVVDDAGDTYRGYSKDGYAWIRKINRQGNTVWNNKINTTAYDPDTNVSIIIKPVKNALIAIMQNPVLEQLTVQRLDLQGSKIWETTLSSFIGNLYYLGGTSVDANENLYVAVNELIDDQNKYWLTKVNKLGAVEWKKALFTCSHCLEGMQVIGNNLFYLKNQNGQHDLVSLNDSGNQRWQQSYYDESPFLHLAAAGERLFLWGGNTLRSVSSAGDLLASIDMQVTSGLTWNGVDTLFLTTPTHLLAMDLVGNVKNSIAFPANTDLIRYSNPTSPLMWHEEKHLLAFTTGKNVSAPANEAFSETIEIYDEALTLKASYKGAVENVTTCGFPGCYIPRTSGDDWRAIGFASNDLVVVSGVKKQDGYYTAAYKLP